MKIRWLNRVISSCQGEGLRAQLMRGGFGVGIIKIVSLLITMVVTVILARGLGPDGFGQYAFIVALVTSLSIPVAPAIMQLATREIASVQQSGEEHRFRSFFHWANRHVLIGSFLIILVVAVIAIANDGWQDDNRWSLLIIALFVVPLLGFNAVNSGFLTGLRRVVVGQLPELFVKPVVMLILIYFLWLVGYLNAATAMVAFVCAAALALVSSIIFLNRSYSNLGFLYDSNGGGQREEWSKAWLPFALLVAASTLNAQIGILLLGWLSTNEQVAAMQIAEKGAALVLLSLLIVNQVIGPHITQVYLSNDKKKLQALSRQSARMAFLVSLPFALPLILWGEPLIKLVLGDEYAEISTVPLAILGIAQIFNVAFGSVGRLLVMSGFEAQSLQGQAIALVTVLLLGLALIPEFGAVGASIAIAFGIIVWNSILAFKVVKVLGIRPGIF